MTQLSDLVTVSRRYQRSIHLERDELVPDALAGYQLTPVALQSLDRIVAGLAANSGARAWSLTGPYGSGKSSFAVFLAALLSGDKSRGSAGAFARRLLKETSPERFEQIFGRSGRGGPKPLARVLVTAERQPLSLMLLRGMAATVERLWKGRRKPKILETLAKQIRSIEGGREAATSKVVKLLEQVRDQAVASELASGLVLVVDEAGKALEYAAQHPRQSDVLLLQEVAELAARSGETPVVFVTVFHQAFKGYAARLSPAQRNEWEKVQGRFEDVAFVDGWDQTVRFVADALSVERKPAKAWREADSGAKKALECVELPPVLSGEATASALLEGLPLHPFVTLLLGPLFRSGVFQNERSLFAFLSSREPFALQEHLTSSSCSKSVDFYRLDALYDYVTTVLDSRGSFGRGQALQAAEIGLRRVPDSAGELGAAVVKSIALIAWLGDKVGLRADEATLRAALGNAVKPRQFKKTLAALADGSIVTYRRFRSSYVLWEGSDIQLDELLESSSARSLTSSQAASLLEEIAPQKPLVARRHLFETGTLRYFPVRFIPQPELREALLAEAGEGDGNVLVVIAANEGERDSAIHLLTEGYSAVVGDERKRPNVAVIPNNAARLVDLLGELAALRHLPNVEPALHEDPVAKREVQARVEDVKALLRSEIGGIFGTGARDGLAQWFVGGEARSVERARDVSTLVSAVCDEAYDRAPHIHNELLNREQLSSAAASARRNLLDAMLNHADHEELAIEGFPPEKSMYLSFIREHRLHGSEHGQWGLKAPPKTSKKPLVHDAWRSLKGFLNEHEGQRLSVVQVYEHLRRPPYGMKMGVIPVVFIHFYALNAEALALYEADSFIPSLDMATVERMLRKPQHFQVQWFPVTEGRRDLLRRVGEELGVSPPIGRKEPTVLQVVKKLSRIYNDLPHYGRMTKRVPAEAVQVRHALTLAKEPAPLIFRALPAAFGIERFSTRASGRANDAEAFARMLGEATRSLVAAYSDLLTHIESTVAEAFGFAYVDDEALRQGLALRAARVLPHAVAPKLRSFLVRLIDGAMPREEWTVSLGTLLGKKPPEHWVDGDVEVFETELRVVRQHFTEMESLVLREGQDQTEAQKGDESREGRLLRLSVSELGAPTMERVVNLEAPSKPSESFEGRLLGLIKEHAADLSLDTQLGILGVVAADLIRDAERSSIGASERGLGDE